MELSETALNGKAFSPENIIRDITDGNFMSRGTKAVGFIGDVPAVFTWQDNIIQITTTLCSETREILPRVSRVASDITERDKSKRVDTSDFQNVIWVKTFIKK